MTRHHAIARILLTCLPLLLSACGDFEPREKKATYDPATHQVVMPYPCPDWSHNPWRNNDNSVHSNFGCATETNLGAQLENPADLQRGHGTASPDTESTVRVIEQYRAGDIPVPLTPEEDSGSSQ